MLFWVAGAALASGACAPAAPASGGDGGPDGGRENVGTYGGEATTGGPAGVEERLAPPSADVICPPGQPCPFPEPCLPQRQGDQAQGACEPPEEPTVPPPASPSRLTYTPFSESRSIAAQWTPSLWAGTYQLQQSADGGGWADVYVGGSLATWVTVPAEGRYQYRVRACNGAGCSGYTSFVTTVVSGPPRRHGPAAASELRSAAPWPSGDAIVPPRLGVGYDRLRQETTDNVCLDSAGAAVANTPALAIEFTFEVVQTREELASTLNVASNLGAGVNSGAISARFDDKRAFVEKATRVEETHLVVIHLRTVGRVEHVLNPSDLPLRGDKVALLGTGRAATYRNECGDAFVDSIEYGREAFVTIQLTSQRYSRDERQDANPKLKG